MVKVLVYMSVTATKGIDEVVKCDHGQARAGFLHLWGERPVSCVGVVDLHARSVHLRTFIITA